MYPRHHHRLSWTLVLIWVCCAMFAQNDLFISEYVESTSNKCIEILNPTDRSINLGGVYRLRKSSDGNPISTLRNLSGSIPPKSTLVTCTSGSSFPFDLSLGVAGFNGNDAIILEKNGSAIDIFGNPECGGDVPMDAWQSGGLSTSDVTLVRKPCIRKGVRNDPPNTGCPFPTLSSEWIEFSQNDLSHLGSHDFLYEVEDVTVSHPTSCGSNDAMIEVTADGNGLEYSKDGNSWQSSPIFNNLSPGTYTIVVRTKIAPSCRKEYSIQISEPDPPEINDIDIVQPSNCQTSDGEIHIVANGADIEYSIDEGHTFQSSGTFSGLASGSYDIMIRSGGSDICTDETRATLFDPESPTILQIKTSAITDCLDANGSIEIETSGPDAQYSINNGVAWSNDPLFSGLSDGVYQLVVRNRDAASCLEQEQISISAINDIETVLVGVEETSCTGERDGSIEIEVSGGSGSYQFNWSGPSNIDDKEDPSRLPGGMYSVTVSDLSLSNCQSELGPIEVRENTDVRDYEIETLPIFCESDTPYKLPEKNDGINGGWLGPGVHNSRFNPAGLSGEIDLRFVPSQGQCAATKSVAIRVNKSITPELDPIPDLCSNYVPIELPDVQDGLDGNWSGPGITSNILDPSTLAGTIRLTFTPDASCTTPATLEVKVTESAPLDLDLPTSICLNDPPLTLPPKPDNVEGRWTGPGVNGDILDPNGLQGTIELKFTPDPGSCAQPTDATIVIKEPTEPTLSLPTAVCISGPPLELPRSVSGVSGSYSGDFVKGYKFFPDTSVESSEVTFTPDPGTCRLPVTTTIEIDPGFTTSISKTAPSCHDSEDGAVHVDIIDGNVPVTFDWSNDGVADIDDTDQLVDIKSGSYEVRIEDQLGCRDTVLVTLEAPSPLIISYDQTISTDSLFEVEILVDGGTSPYSYTWDTGNSSPSVQGLSEGFYNVTVADANGCNGILSMELKKNACQISFDTLISPISCHGGADGEIILWSNDSGISYEWSHDPMLKNNIAIGLGAGLFQVKAQNATGCTAQFDFHLKNPDSLQVETLWTNESQAGAHDGTIDLSIEGGTGTYSVLWNDLSMDIHRMGLTPGIYIYAVEDSLGCFVQDTVTISEVTCMLDASLVAIDASCHNSNDGMAKISVYHNENVSFKWSHDPTLQSDSASNLPSGTYTITVSDSSGCEVTHDFEIVSPEAITIESSIEFPVDSLRDDGQIMVAAYGGTGTHQFQWSTGDTAPVIEGLSVGNYELIVSDQNNCRDTFHFSLHAQSIPCSFHPTVNADYHCDFGGTASVVDPGGDWQFSWSFDPLLSTSEMIGLNEGVHYVVVSDGSGCSDTLEFEISRPGIDYWIEERHETISGAEDGHIQILVADTSHVGVLWSNDEKGWLLDSVGPGNYLFEITGRDVCPITDSVVISAGEVCSIDYLAEISPSHCNHDDGTIFLEVINAVGIPEVSWLNLNIESNYLENLAPGSYPFLIEDGSCRLTDTLLVSEKTLEIDVQIYHHQCNQDGGIEVRIDETKSPIRIMLDDTTEVSPSAFQALPPGIHHLEAQGEKCTVRDTIEILSGFDIHVTPDTTIKFGQQIDLQARVDTSQFASYGWSDRAGPLCSHCTTVEIQPQESDTYHFYYRLKEGCYGQMETRVRVEKSGLVYVPNAYSLNGDGLNESFQVYDPLGLVDHIISFEVFDRRGTLVYKKEGFQANEALSDFGEIAQDVMAPYVLMSVLKIKMREGRTRKYVSDITIIK